MVNSGTYTKIKLKDSAIETENSGSYSVYSSLRCEGRAHQNRKKIILCCRWEILQGNLIPKT